MKYYKFHVTYYDDGQLVIIKHKNKSVAKQVKAFLESCARSDGKIREIELIEYK